MATVPDFGALASQQSAANNAATDKTNLANRSNQSGPMGSLTWTMGPNGQWTQNVGLSPDAGFMFNQSIQGQNALGSQIGQGINTSDLMGWGNADLTRGAVAMPDSGFGATQSVIDAWNALQQPGLDKNAAAERNRLAAQGLTLGSRASNNSENNIATNYRQAANEGILRGTQEYQNVFNRGMQSRQQTVAENTRQAELINAMRGQQFGERTGAYNAAIAGNNALTSTRDSLNPNKWLPEVKAAAAYLPEQRYTAAMDTFGAQRDQENAATAQRNADRAANTNLANTGLNALGGASGIWGIGKDLWSGGKDLYNWATGSQQGITDYYGAGNENFGSDWGNSYFGTGNTDLSNWGGGGGATGWDFGNPYEGTGFDTSGLGAWGGAGSSWNLTNSW